VSAPRPDSPDDRLPVERFSWGYFATGVCALIIIIAVICAASLKFKQTATAELDLARFHQTEAVPA
jgi:bacteriorhodopsin